MFARFYFPACCSGRIWGTLSRELARARTRHFHGKFAGIIRYDDTSRCRVVPWNTADLTGRINTAVRVLSVTGEKRVASASSVAESGRTTVFASSRKQYAMQRDSCESLPLDSPPPFAAIIHRANTFTCVAVRAAFRFHPSHTLRASRCYRTSYRTIFLHGSTCILSM